MHSCKAARKDSRMENRQPISYRRELLITKVCEKSASFLLKTTTAEIDFKYAVTVIRRNSNLLPSQMIKEAFIFSAIFQNTYDKLNSHIGCLLARSTRH